MSALDNSLSSSSPWLTVVWGVFSTTFYISILYTLLWWLWDRRRQHLMTLYLNGPLVIPFLGSLPTVMKLCCTTNYAKVAYETFKGYSSPFRFWFGTKFVLGINDPEDIEFIVNKNAILNKPKLYSYWANAIGDGLLTAFGGSMWKKHRSILAPVFHPQAMEGHQDIVNRHCHELIKHIQILSGKGPVDVELYITRFCFDVMADTLLKDDSTDFQRGANDSVLHAISNMRKLVQERMTRFWLYPDFVYARSEGHCKMNKQRDIVQEYIINQFTDKKVQYLKEKRKTSNNGKIKNGFVNSTKSKNAIDVMLEAQYKSENLSDMEIIDELINTISAGADKSTSCISLFAMSMAMHPEYQEILYQELRDFYGEDIKTAVQLKDLNRLPYLNSCTKEVMRMFPPIALSVRHTGEDIHFKSKNQIIPKNTYICFPWLVINKSPHRWREPTRFNPNRFMDTDDSDNTKEKICSPVRPHPYNFNPFGVGSRDCIGKHLGEQLVKTAMVELLRRFRFHTEAKMEDLRFDKDLNLRSSRGYVLTITDRTSYSL